MSEEINQMPQTNPPNNKSPASALMLAFLPSVLLLGLFTYYNNKNNLQTIPMVIACVVSIVCCFASAIMLFRRNTCLAIFAGIIFLLLNAAISFLFGCGVILSKINF